MIQVIENTVLPKGYINYAVRGWTPGGDRLILYYGHVATEDINYSFISPAAGAEPDPVKFKSCCDYSFTPDGKMLFAGARFPGFPVGVWKIDPRTGKVTELAPDTSMVEQGGGPYDYFHWPKQAPGGRLWFFYAQPAREMLNNSQSIPFHLAYANGSKAISSPQDVHIVGKEEVRLEWQVLWAPDASLAVIGNHDGIIVVYASDGRVVRLGMTAYNLSWGK